MISPNSPSWRGVNRSFAGAGAGASNGGQLDWAPAAEPRKIKIKKKTVKRMAYPPSTFAAESNTRSFRWQHAQAWKALTVLDFPPMREYRPHDALAQLSALNSAASQISKCWMRRPCDKDEALPEKSRLFLRTVSFYTSTMGSFLVTRSCLRCDRGVGSSIFRTIGCSMITNARYFAAIIFLTFPAIAQAQSTGQVECPRSGGYVYLYSSMITLDVRTTLQCGEVVQITGRYDLYFGVRTAKGEIGYVPVESLLLLKDKPGARAPEPKAVQPARERILYDAPKAPTQAVSNAQASPTDFALCNGTPIRMRLGKTISSATAHVGDVVELKVVEEVTVDGLLVIPEGATAIGLVTDAEPKKRMGHGGKLALSINFVRLKDDEKAAVRSFQESTGSNNSTGAVLPLSSGKDVVFAQGAE